LHNFFGWQGCLQWFKLPKTVSREIFHSRIKLMFLNKHEIKFPLEAHLVTFLLYARYPWCGYNLGTERQAHNHYFNFTLFSMLLSKPKIIIFP
jgi:hypothetical protein